METLKKFKGRHSDQGSAVDSLALEITRDMNLKSAKSGSQVAQWENEDLAKVKIKVFRGHEDEVNKCQFFADESRVMSIGKDCTIKIWNPKEGTVVQSVANAHTLNAVDAHCTEDGSRLITCGWDKKVIFWDLEKGQKIWSAEHSDILNCCRLSYSGHLVCVGSDLLRELTLYDMNTGEAVQRVKDHHQSSLTSCLFTPDDCRVTTTSTDRTAKFYDLCSKKCTITLEGHENIISSCAISVDERKFATSSWDKTIHIWDVATGMYRSKGPAILKNSHDGSVTSCSFTEDGLQLVSGSADMSIVVWDVENSMQKMKLQGHAGWVTDVHFSQDQCWLLSCAKDKTVRMWNIEESDTIPLVMENKYAHGLKVTKCTNCGKPFSITEMENFQEMSLCVFCRLQSPEKTWLSFSDDPDV